MTIISSISVKPDSCSVLLRICVSILLHSNLFDRGLSLSFCY
jgi:hypothetical protein